jgi:hypothetical protein
MKSNMLPAVELAGAILVFAAASPALAHHSAAAYDYTKTETAVGTIKTFRFASPHCAMVVAVKRADGKVTELFITSAAPMVYARQGFKSEDFKAGDKLSLTWHPGRNDESAGVVVSMTLKNGRTFKE